MQSFEIGILPQSRCFSFSPTAQVQNLFYHHIWCGHFYCNNEYYIKRDSYPPLLLVYVCNGNFCLELGAQKYTATAGEVILFDCSQPHYYYSENDIEFLYMHFDGPKAHEICQYINKSSGTVIDNPNNELIREELMNMLEFYENGNSENIFATSNRIYKIFSLLDNPSKSPRLKKNDDSISRAIAFIRSNVGTKITLHQLANISGLSDYYFSHLFKEHTGQSPTEFIINSRIDQAKIRLANTNLSITDIAKEVGYPNSANLITLFTQRVGCSPSQFRKNIRPGE